MEEQRIKFETALLAKEVGFLEYVENEYDSNGELRFNYDNKKSYWINKQCNNSIDKFSAPTQSILQKWLREIHNCHVETRFHSPEDSLVTKENLRYCVEVNYYGKNFNIPLTDEEDFLAWDFETYEEALEVGLFEGLKLIKDEKRNN